MSCSNVEREVEAEDSVVTERIAMAIRMLLSWT